MGLLRASCIVATTAIIYMYMSSFFKVKPTIDKDSFVAPGWERVFEVFRESFETGTETGGSFAVYYEGKLVFNGMGGYADEYAKVPYSQQTLVQMFSTTKAIAAVVVAQLVDRGLLDYKSPVAKYWPEFAQNGKERITVEQLVSHQAGLPYTEKTIDYRDLHDNPEMLGEILAEQRPLWEPGTAFGYHALSVGLYIDQLVRKVDLQKRSFAKYFEDEFATPFDLEIFIGLPRSENYRAAVTYDGNVFSNKFLTAYKYWFPVWFKYLFQPDSLLPKSVMDILNPDFSFNNPSIREVGHPSANGFATARSLAKFFGILANGGTLGGKTMIKEKYIRQLQEVVISGTDRVMGINSTYGRGMLLLPTPTGGYMIGTPGAGGQMGYADPDNKLGWAHLTNYHGFHMADDPRYEALKNAMYACVAEIQAKKTSRT